MIVLRMGWLWEINLLTDTKHLGLGLAIASTRQTLAAVTFPLVNRPLHCCCNALSQMRQMGGREIT